MSGSEPVQIKVTVDELDAISDFKKLEKQSTKTFRTFTQESKKGEKSAKRFSKAVRGIKGKLLGLAGGIGLVASIRKSVMLFLEQERAVIRLEQALKLQGVTAKSVSKDMQEYAAALQRITIHGDEAHLAGMSLAMSMGATADQARDLAMAAAELSAAMGIGLDQATRQMAKTLGGFAGELGEILPGLKEFNREQLQSGAAIGMIRTKFAGSAAALAGTQGGQLSQAMNKLGDEMEKLGKVLAPAAVLLVQTAADAAGWTKGAIQAYQTALTKGYIAFGADIGPGVVRAEARGAGGQLAAAKLRQRRMALNAFLGPAGMRSLGAGTSEGNIAGLEGARGDLTAAQVAKVVEGSLTGVEKARRNIGFLQNVQGFLGTREGIPDEEGVRHITPRRNRIDRLIRGEQLAISRTENPEIHRFTEDLGMGMQQSLEGALKTAFTGGGTRAILDQFSTMLGEAVASSLAQNLAAGILGSGKEGGITDMLDDIALMLGSSSDSGGGESGI